MADFRFLNPITVLSDIGGISIDVTQRLEEDYEHIITQNPIEDGSPTTDHVTNLPPKINLRGGFSDIRITNLLGTILDPTAAIKGRAKTEFDKLLDLFVSRETFLVMDGLHLFKDMQFKRLQLLKEKEGFALFFEAEIWNIRKISLGLGASGPTIKSPSDSVDRFLVTPQLLTSVGAVSVKDSLQSIGVLL
jgi:hypothetical protein